VRDLIDGVYSEKGQRRLKSVNETAAIEALSEKDLSKRIKLLEKQMLDHAATSNSRKRPACRSTRPPAEQAFGAPALTTSCHSSRARQVISWQLKELPAQSRPNCRLRLYLTKLSGSAGLTLTPGLVGQSRLHFHSPTADTG